MTKQQMSQAMELAYSKEDLSNVDISIFDGYGLADFGSVFCTIRQVARLIRWQCIQWNGELDAHEWDALCWAARNRFNCITAEQMAEDEQYAMAGYY